MKKYGFNSGYIGSDQRTSQGGVISFQKHYIERLSNRMRPAGSDIRDLLITDGLIMLVDATNPNSYPGDGNWYDLSGNANHWVTGGGPVLNDGGTIATTYLSFDSTDDYAKQSAASVTGRTSAMTVGMVIQSQDAGKGMIASKSTGGGGYLAAFNTNGNFYHNGVGSPTAYIDTVANEDSEGLDDSFHMLEFKSVDFSGWSSDINMPPTYSGYQLQAFIKLMFIYDRALTFAESQHNFTQFQSLQYTNQ